jgi:GGDEF domain-containing protein
VFAGRAVEAVRNARIRRENSPGGMLTVSIGVSGSALAAAAPDWSVMVRLADEALYAAKAAGRNRWTTAKARESATGLTPQPSTT